MSPETHIVRPGTPPGMLTLLCHVIVSLFQLWLHRSSCRSSYPVLISLMHNVPTLRQQMRTIYVWGYIQSPLPLWGAGGGRVSQFTSFLTGMRPFKRVRLCLGTQTASWVPLWFDHYKFSMRSQLELLLHQMVNLTLEHFNNVDFRSTRSFRSGQTSHFPTFHANKRLIVLPVGLQHTQYPNMVVLTAHLIISGGSVP